MLNPVNYIKSFATSGNNRTQVVKQNIMGTFVLRITNITISLLLVPATIGYVNADLYGVWLALASIMTWLNFVDVGFTTGLKNKLAEALAKDDYARGKTLVSTTYFMMLLIFIPVCIILELLVPQINWPGLLNIDSSYSDDIQRVMHALIAFASIQMIANVIISVSDAFQKVALSSLFGVLGNAFALIIIIFLRLTCPPSLLVLAFPLAAMPIIVTIIASFVLFSGRFKKVSPNIHYIKKDNINDLFSLGYKFFIINIQVLVLYQSTNILISHVSSPLDVTNYNIAYKLLNCAMMAYTIITAPLWPAYTDAYARDDYEWMKNTRNRMKNVLLLSIAGCLFLALLSPFIYRVWVGDSVSIPYTMTFTVALYVIVYCWMNLNGTLIVGMGKVFVETIIVLIGLICHIPLSLFLGQYIGAYGVLTSLIIVNLFYAVIMNIQVSMLVNKKAVGIWNK